MAALKVALSTSRSTGASVSPLLVARTAPEGKEKQRLALRKQVSFKTLSKLNSEDGVRELAKVWSGSNGDGEDAEEEPDHRAASRCLFPDEYLQPQVASNTQLGLRPSSNYLPLLFLA